MDPWSRLTNNKQTTEKQSHNKRTASC
jgi:hypothetical protein